MEDLVIMNDIEALIDGGLNEPSEVESQEAQGVVEEGSLFDDERQEESNEDVTEQEESEEGMFVFDVNGEKVKASQEDLISSFKQYKTLEESYNQLYNNQMKLNEIMLNAMENPWSLLEQLGFNADELATSYIEKQIEEQKELLLNDDKREIRRLKQEQEEFKRKQQEEKEAYEKAQKEKEAREWGMRIEEDILQVLTSNGISKPTPRLIARIAENMLNDLNSNKEVDAKTSYKKAKNAISSDVKEYVNSISVENLLADMDKDTIEKFREYFIKKSKTPFSPKVTGTAQTSNNSAKKTLSELFKDTNIL